MDELIEKYLTEKKKGKKSAGRVDGKFTTNKITFIVDFDVSYRVPEHKKKLISDIMSNLKSFDHLARFTNVIKVKSVRIKS